MNAKSGIGFNQLHIHRMEDMRLTAIHLKITQVILGKSVNMIKLPQTLINLKVLYGIIKPR